MSPEWLAGASILGYGVSLYVGIAFRFPFLTKRWPANTAVKDEDLFTQVYDYSMDYPKGVAKSLGEVSYKELRSGTIMLNGQKITTAPLSSYFKAREIANILKEWIERGDFLLGNLSRASPPSPPDSI